MKRLSLFIAFLGLFCAPLAVHAEVIHDFRVQAKVDSERNLTITETINYDFESADRHGIFRFIPVRYVRDGARYKLHLNNIEVKVDGKKTDVSVSHSGDNIELKIGDADKTITGPHVYEITYETDRAINFFDDHTELYWNVTGDQWQVPIEKSSFSFTFPGSAVPTTTCFTGEYGSTAQDCTQKSGPGAAAFASNRALLAGEGLTAAISIPNGIIRAPSDSEKIWMIIADNIILIVPLITFAIMYYIWRRFGRDPDAETVIAQYESPEGLSPAELLAVKKNGFVPGEGLTATIIDLARRGYLHIRFGEKKRFIGKEKTYTFVKTQGTDTALNVAEMKLYTGLFDGRSEIALEDFQKHKVYLDAAKFREEIKKSTDARALYSKAFLSQVTIYIIVAISWAWIGSFVFAREVLGVIAILVSALPILVFGFLMPRRTKKGVALLAKVKGFELFLSVTEKERLKFHNAPARTPEQFMEFLPAAIALGVEKEWAEQFKDLDMKPPDWAEGNVAGMSYASFSSDMNSISSAASSGFSPPSSSGSGGSGFSGGGSGGGGGGGGGGSW